MNGSSVIFQCDNEYSKSTAQPIECILGQLHPRSPACRAKQIENLPSIDSPHYMGGTDIIKGGDITVLEYGSSKPCGPPAKYTFSITSTIAVFVKFFFLRVQGSLVYRNGEPLVDDERSFPDGTEVTFNCIESIMGEKTTWRIVCEDGSWIGRSLNCGM